MGKGGQGDASNTIVRPLREFTWNEVEEKTKKEDQWIVIEGEVYNITNWARKHPGGSKVISHYAGQDASDAFKAFHNDIKSVKKYMKAIHIGTIKDSSKIVKPIEEDFREIRETAEKMGLFTPSITFYVLTLAHILVLDWAAWAVLYYYGVSWTTWLISLLSISIVQGQCGWLQHDFGHLSTTKDSRLDHALHYFVMGFMKGASAGWWNHMHYQHHAKPNVMDKDPDVRLDALFVVGETMPVEVAKSRKSSMPYNWQNYYFFLIGPPLLFPVYFQFMLFRHIFTRKAWMDLLMVTLFFIKFIYLFVPLLGFGGAVAYYFLFRCIESHWFTWVAQSNHIPMEIERDQALPWPKLQLAATCNVTKSAFNDWFTGHLNFQIEHHLMPTMPRHNLYKIAPLVKSFCEKHDIPYVVKPLSTAFVDIVRTLKNSGELWSSTYNAYYAPSS